jgi:hypothetical protein
MLKTCLRRTSESSPSYTANFAPASARSSSTTVLEHWLRTVETYDRVKAGTEQMIPIEEVIAEFEMWRKERVASQ